jgi:hypothetical protein
VFAIRPLNREVVRSLVVLKLWQARDTFDPEGLMRKFEDGRDFDWDDLGLVRRTLAIDPEKIAADCARGFRFLRNLTEEERILANDQYQREHVLSQRLREAVRT